MSATPASPPSKGGKKATDPTNVREPSNTRPPSDPTPDKVPRPQEVGGGVKPENEPTEPVEAEDETQ